MSAQHPPQMGPRPLSGVRVLEFTHAIMGPSAGLILADLGAEVIHVEPPHGDGTRRLRGMGTGYFTFFSRNKNSLAVDLKKDEGREIIHKLMPSVDIVIENFGPGTMDRLGYGYYYNRLRHGYGSAIHTRLSLSLNTAQLRRLGCGSATARARSATA